MLRILNDSTRVPHELYALRGLAHLEDSEDTHQPHHAEDGEGAQAILLREVLDVEGDDGDQIDPVGDGLQEEDLARGRNSSEEKLDREAHHGDDL